MSDNSRLIQQHNVIGEASREVEIMYHAYCHDVRRGREVSYLLQEVDNRAQCT
jgi:hypothetical protein